MQGHDMVIAPVFLLYMGFLCLRVGDGVMDAFGNEYKTGLAAFRVG